MINLQDLKTALEEQDRKKFLNLMYGDKAQNPSEEDRASAHEALLQAIAAPSEDQIKKEEYAKQLEDDAQIIMNYVLPYVINCDAFNPEIFKDLVEIACNASFKEAQKSQNHYAFELIQNIYTQAIAILRLYNQLDRADKITKNYNDQLPPEEQLNEDNNGLTEATLAGVDESASWEQASAPNSIDKNTSATSSMSALSYSHLSTVLPESETEQDGRMDQKAQAIRYFVENLIHGRYLRKIKMPEGKFEIQNGDKVSNESADGRHIHPSNEELMAIIETLEGITRSNETDNEMLSELYEDIQGKVEKIPPLPEEDESTHSAETFIRGAWSNAVQEAGLARPKPKSII